MAYQSKSHLAMHPRTQMRRYAVVLAPHVAVKLVFLYYLYP